MYETRVCLIRIYYSCIISMIYVSYCIIYNMNMNHVEASWNDSVATFGDASILQGTLKRWPSGSNRPSLLKLIAGGNTWGTHALKPGAFSLSNMCCEEWNQIYTYIYICNVYIDDIYLSIFMLCHVYVYMWHKV